MCVDMPTVPVVSSQDQCLTRSDMWRFTCSLVSLSPSLHPLYTPHYSSSFSSTFSPLSLPLSFPSTLILPPLQIDKCVYTHMKLEFAGMRTQVYDLWSHGKNVSCGAVVKTARVHILKHVFQFQDGLGMRQGTESNVASFPRPLLPPVFYSF